MPMTTNADGTVTYSITVPTPITVTREAGDIYRAGGAVYAIGADPANHPYWHDLAAGTIAILDAHAATMDATALAARDALAKALYETDAPGGDPWSILSDAGRQPYRDRADILGPLGVSAVIA